MENPPFNRAYLESLSTADLVDMADDNGIDIPEGLNRRFIIGELLDLADERSGSARDSGILVETDITASHDALPETYNETGISVLLRDPGWVFVYWDFHSNLFSAITQHHRFETFFLRVNSLSSASPATLIDYFDVEVGVYDRKWYVHFPGKAYACRVDLYTKNSQEKEQLLARSPEIVIPCCEILDGPIPGSRKESPVLELSGITVLRKNHFRNHRQSFGS
ncbi:MAG: DUF4912 domain-containing protein [Treponema sp.]|nr:MAG: DUF4912 domain-containing protein [Treponema sp.]